MRALHMSADQHSRRRTRLRRVIAALSVLALLGGLSGAQALGAPSTSPRSPRSTVGGPAVPSGQRPPPVRLSSSGITLAMKPYTACWFDDEGGFCYDGIPPHPLPSLGGLWGPVSLSFARDGWHFSVTAVDSAGHRTKVGLVRLGDRAWHLALGQLPDGRYRVDLFGQGPEGDVAASGAFTSK